MTNEYNSYETKTLGIYGNGTDVIFVNKNGKAFIVQSPDKGTRDAIPTDNYLPADMVVYGDRDCEAIEIPEWIYEAK